MLDEIEKVAMNLLSMSKDEVRQVRDALLVEVASDDSRYAARTALKHPEGSTTPLNEAADRSQQTYAKVRERLMKELPKLLGLILAEQVAREQRDEAAVARDRHWDAEYERRAVGPHPETRDLFARLFKHGVTPWHLKALRDEEVAIIADLIRWKANDARYKKADNPWRGVLRDYANRLILEADYGVTVKQSIRGTPVRGKRYTSPKYYMFNEMVKPHWSAAPAAPTNAGDQYDDDQATAVPDQTEQAVSAAQNLVAIEQVDMPEPGTAASEQVALGDDTAQEEADQERPSVQAGEIQIDAERARIIAEGIFTADRWRMKIYWPADVQEGDYEPSALIPALERMVGSSRSWSGAERFLEAARRGEARQFIETRRADGIAYLATQLQAGEDKALAAAREFGLV